MLRVIHCLSQPTFFTVRLPFTLPQCAVQYIPSYSMAACACPCTTPSNEGESGTWKRICAALFLFLNIDRRDNRRDGPSSAGPRGIPDEGRWATAVAARMYREKGWTERVKAEGERQREWSFCEAMADRSTTRRCSSLGLAGVRVGGPSLLRCHDAQERARVAAKATERAWQKRKAKRSGFRRLLSLPSFFSRLRGEGRRSRVCEKE